MPKSEYPRASPAAQVAAATTETEAQNQQHETLSQEGDLSPGRGLSLMPGGQLSPQLLDPAPHHGRETPCDGGSGSNREPKFSVTESPKRMSYLSLQLIFLLYSTTKCINDKPPVSDRTARYHFLMGIYYAYHSKNCLKNPLLRYDCENCT